MVAKLGKVNLMERRFSLQNISNLEDYSGGLYLRLSKEDDKKGGMNIADNSASIENQKALLEKYANEHHINIYDIYIDDGYSGTSFERPAFQRMLSDIEDGKINMVLTKDMSRLGRNDHVTLYYMECYFPEHGVRYISLLDGIDTGEDNYIDDKEGEWFMEFLKRMDMIKVKAKKIGNDQRMYLQYFYRELFNEESDSYADLLQAVENGYRKYDSQVNGE